MREIWIVSVLEVNGVREGEGFILHTLVLANILPNGELALNASYIGLEIFTLSTSKISTPVIRHITGFTNT